MPLQPPEILPIDVLTSRAKARLVWLNQTMNKAAAQAANSKLKY